MKNQQSNKPFQGSFLKRHHLSNSEIVFVKKRHVKAEQLASLTPTDKLMVTPENAEYFLAWSYDKVCRYYFEDIHPIFGPFPKVIFLKSASLFLTTSSDDHSCSDVTKAIFNKTWDDAFRYLEIIGWIF